jgi:transcriptional regulator
VYVPEHFAAADSDALIAKLARRCAGILVSVDADGEPVATHMPVLWNAEKRIATGHIARANPQWKLGAGRALIVLSGAEAYVSPSYYPSKKEHGKTVPTWNYEAVHLSGAIEWFDDPARLEAVVRDLSAFHEHGRAEPWSIGDSPRPYIDALLRGIVGVEMRVERVEAKRKLSQNKSAGDFDGVIAGLEAEDEGAEIAALMRATRAVSDDPDGN